MLLSKQKNIGIILYETIVAAVVVTVCISITLKAFTSSLRSARISVYYLKANTLLKNKFSEYFLSPFLEPGIFEGSFGEDLSDFSWTASVEDLSASEEAIEEIEPQTNIEEPEKSRLFMIEIDVYWKMKEKIKKVSMVSLLKKTAGETYLEEEKEEKDMTHKDFLKELRQRRQNRQGRK